ncbi:MAG: branched-chain amino acid ABC transporter permease [Alphaproteobacteria bacterium]
MQFVSILIAGIAIGSVYSLMALAINIVFSARRVVNFAQGDIVMLAGLVGVTLISAWAVPYILGLLIVCIATAALAVLIERVAIRSMATDESSIAWILSIVSVAIILSNAATLGFGTEPRPFPSLVSSRPIDVAGARIVPDHLATIVGAIALMLIFNLLQERTIHGKAMRAAARDPAMASMLGIPIKAYIVGAFAVSGVMAAMAGFLVGPLTFVSAQLGFALGIKGFAAAALGGLGSFRGAVVGGILLGVAETLSATYLGSSVKNSVSLVALCLILIFRPTGLFGESPVKKM